MIAKDGSFGTIDVVDPETKKLVRQNVVAITVKTDDKTGIATEGMTKAIKTSGGFNGLLESVRKIRGHC